MLPTPEDKRKNTGPGDCSEQKPHPNYGEYFRFRAISYLQDFYAYVNHYKTSKGKRDYFARAGRRYWRRIVRSTIAQLTATSLAVGLIAYWLYINERLDPDWIVAIFTAA